MEKNYLKLSEYARRVGVTRQAVYGWVKSGVIKSHCAEDGTKLVHVPEADKNLKELGRLKNLPEQRPEPILLFAETEEKNTDFKNEEEKSVKILIEEEKLKSLRLDNEAKEREKAKDDELLISREKTEAAEYTFASIIRDQITQIPFKTCDELSTIDSPDVIQNYLTSEIDKILANIATELKKKPWKSIQSSKT